MRGNKYNSENSPSTIVHESTSNGLLHLDPNASEWAALNEDEDEGQTIDNDLPGGQNVKKNATSGMSARNLEKHDGEC